MIIVNDDSEDLKTLAFSGDETCRKKSSRRNGSLCVRPAQVRENLSDKAFEIK